MNSALLGGGTSPFEWVEGFDVSFASSCSKSIFDWSSRGFILDIFLPQAKHVLDGSSRSVFLGGTEGDRGVSFLVVLVHWWCLGDHLWVVTPGVGWRLWGHFRVFVPGVDWRLMPFMINWLSDVLQD